MISLACASVYAQDATTSPPAAVPSKSTASVGNATTLAAVVVTTGTRVFNRTALSSLAPIDVLTPQDIKATGVTDLTAALRILLPSINFVQAANVDQGDSEQPAELRGLSPDQTLVLINGKRQHMSSVMHFGGVSYADGTNGTDLASIPLNAIERIEVLRDGAAAQYGSDAIAGVINIILKGGDQHGSASVTHGMYDAGDGSLWQGSADGGFALGTKGWVHLSANASHQDPTNRAGPDLRFPGDPTFGKQTFNDGLPLTSTKQGAINFQYDLTPQAQLYGFSVLNARNGSSGAYFRSLSSYATDHPEAVTAHPDGFLPTEHSALRDDSEVLGLRGMAYGWHYDISANTGGNRFNFHMTNSFNYSLGAESPTSFSLGGSSNRQNVATADFSRLFYVNWLKNPLNVAWGLEYSDDEYTLKAGAPNSYFGSGTQGFGGFQAADASTHSRQNKAAYIDLETDFTDKWTGDVAVRHEHYSDFGNTTPVKFSSRYAFSNTWALRGTVSTGFRAPSLAQEYYASTSTSSKFDPTTGTLELYESRQFPPSDPVAEALGSKPLKPEQSRNYSVGLVFTPPGGFSSTLDLYQININDRIVSSGNLSGDAVAAYLTSAGFPFVVGGSFFTNAIDTRTRGADLVASYPLDMGESGTLDVTGGVNYNLTQILSVKANPEQLGLAGLTLDVFTDEERGFLTTQNPKFKAFLGANWHLGNWMLRGQVTRYGAYKIGDQTAITAVDQYPPARYLLDVSATYNLGRWAFTLGSNNVTNTYPRKNLPLNNFSGNFVYPESSPFSYEGAYYYGTASFSW